MKKEKLILIISSILIICALAAIVIQVVQNGFVKKEDKVEATGDTFRYSKSVASGEAIKYLLTQEDVAKNAGVKNIVVYYTGKDWNLADNMKSAIEQLQEKEDFASTYYFHPEADKNSKFFLSQDEALAYVEFNKLCEQFCIVNPVKKQIIQLENITEENINELAEILTKFKD